MAKQNQKTEQKKVNLKEEQAKLDLLAQTTCVEILQKAINEIEAIGYTASFNCNIVNGTIVSKGIIVVKIKQ